MLGKSLEGYEVDDKDIVHRMIAVQNGIHFMAVMKNMDTVVVGHKNAERLKNAIGANYYPIHQPDDSETRGRVVFSSKAKRIIYVPTEALLYGPQSQFDAATKIIISTFENLKKSNNCDTVIMLPIFRHVKFSEKSQAFVKWYKEMATKNQDYIGMKEIDEMKLIHWLNATPNNAATEYVDEYGILTEAGTRRLAEYLNSVGFACTHRVLQMENVSEPLSNPIQSKEITNRGGYRNRGTSLTRGKYTTFSRNTRRGFKRNAHEEQSEYAPSNRQRRDQRNK
uniref:Uncharacterized protein n=1 Tax=Panagrolaimus sp. ES5 TaxID=591445 RepID=A0AC34GGR7_9BILA